MPPHIPTVIKQNSLAIVLLIFVSLMIVLITEDSNQRAAELVQHMGKSAETRRQLAKLTQGVLEAESGQRGYLLTNDPSFLAPYNNALKTIETAWATLDATYGKDPRAADLLKKLHDLTESKLAEIAITIRMQSEGRQLAGRDFVISGIGKEYMDAIQTVGTELRAVESARMESSAQKIANILFFCRVGVALLTAITLVLIYVNMRFTRAFREQHVLHQQALLAEQDRLQAEVARCTGELVDLTNYLETAREDERLRIACDLHDELGALLTGAKLDAASIRTLLRASAPQAAERLDRLQETLNAGIAIKRRIIEDLRPSTLGNLGLVPTLEILANEFAKRTGIAVHSELACARLPNNRELVIFRLVQEATTNIAKHAKARNVWITLENTPNGVQVTVEDDGVGFNPSQVSSKTHGLVGMRYRVEAEDGRLDLVTSPGGGTLLRARFAHSQAPGKVP